MTDIDRYKNCKTIGIAIKVTGDLLRPFLKDQSHLISYIDSLQPPADLRRFHPLPILLDLFQVAEKNGLVERLAKAWALNVVREMRHQGSISTPQMALKMIAAGFPRQHQGNVGEVIVSFIDDKRATLVDSTYAPCGYISTFVQQTIANFGAINISSKHLKSGCRQRGGSTCEYEITWEESDLLQMSKSFSFPASS